MEGWPPSLNATAHGGGHLWTKTGAGHEAPASTRTLRLLAPSQAGAVSR